MKRRILNPNHQQILSLDRVVFIHIPKTGGSFIERALFNYVENKSGSDLEQTLVFGGHHFRQEMERYWDLRRYLLFSVIRNPYDRLISCWNYLSRSKSEKHIAYVNALGNPNSLEDFITSIYRLWQEDPTFQYTGRYLKHDSVSLEYWKKHIYHILPQVNYLEATDGEVSNVMLLRYETLDTDFKRLTERVQEDRSELTDAIKAYILPNIKVRPSYDLNISAKYKEMVNLVYQRDFDELDYKRNGRAIVNLPDNDQAVVISGNSGSRGKTYFCTYGDQKFTESRERIVSEASETQLFDASFLYTESIRDIEPFASLLKENTAFANVANAQRGGGYWIWKPFVILQCLEKLGENDILVYADAGCSMPAPEDPENIRKLEFYIETCRQSEYSALAWRNPFKESDWSKGDLLKHFGALDDKAVARSRQFTANRIIVKKCDSSIKLLKKWCEIATTHPELFSDEPSVTPNLAGFKEHRHDQSVWSIICKTYGVSESYEWDDNPIKLTRIRK